MYGHKWWLCWKISVQCGRQLNFLHSDITVIILHGQILILCNWRPYLSITPRSYNIKGALCWDAETVVTKLRLGGVRFDKQAVCQHIIPLALELSNSRFLRHAGNNLEVHAHIELLGGKEKCYLSKILVLWETVIGINFIVRRGPCRHKIRPTNFVLRLSVSSLLSQWTLLSLEVTVCVRDWTIKIPHFARTVDWCVSYKYHKKQQNWSFTYNWDQPSWEVRRAKRWGSGNWRQVSSA